MRFATCTSACAEVASTHATLTPAFLAQDSSCVTRGCGHPCQVGCASTNNDCAAFDGTYTTCAYAPSPDEPTHLVLRKIFTKRAPRAFTDDKPEAAPTSCCPTSSRTPVASPNATTVRAAANNGRSSHPAGRSSHELATDGHPSHVRSHDLLRSTYKQPSRPCPPHANAKAPNSAGQADCTTKSRTLTVTPAPVRYCQVADLHF